MTRRAWQEHERLRSVDSSLGRGELEAIALCKAEGAVFAMLRKAGFIQRAGKGSHTVWSHPDLAKKIVLSGKDGVDAKPYQERDVLAALRRLEGIISIIRGKEVELFKNSGETGAKFPEKFDFSPVF